MAESERKLTDEYLLKQSLKDPRLFRQLFDRYESIFSSVASLKLRDSQEAREVVQDTFISIYKSGHTFKGGSFKAWVFRILNNKIIDAIRARKPTVVLQEHYIQTEDNRPDSFVQKAVRSAINTLDSITQLIVKQHYIHGRNQKEIAKEFNMSHDMVRQRLSRARKILKNKLIQQYDA